MFANEAECRALGLDPDEVERIARRLDRAARDARKLGLEVFGGSSGSLRSITSGKPLVVAEITGGTWNGGDGATMRDDDDGLTYGEY
jgi:hypothetical protein